MFTAKKQKLFKTEVKTKTSASKELNVSKNPFLHQGLKTSAEIFSGNGALKYSTTGNSFVDQFGKIGSYKAPRSYQEIASDMSILWAEDNLLTAKFVLYLRLITRQTELFDGTKLPTTQRGAGMKHESIVRMIWLAINHKEAFYNTIGLFISAGSWNDVIQMLSYDLQFNGWDGKMLDWEFMGKVIMAGLENQNTTNLVRKYLPSIRPTKRCNTVASQADNLISKWICSLIFGNKSEENPGVTYKLYRELKKNGTAHQWQQLISQGKHKLVNFNTVHGRALSLLVSGKYLANNGLEEKYEEWIASKPIAKFTGYPHELFAKMPTKKYQIDTLNAQFKGLVETAKSGANKNTGMIVVRDTSGSMGSLATGTKQSCFDIAKALALFFSEMLPEGYFANSWIEFNSDAKMHTWKGSTPYEKWVNDRSGYIGSTNFQSVINLFARIKASGVSETDFPSGIICISDGEFNPSSLGATNVEAARKTLRSAGFSDEYVDNFKIVLWNLQSGYYGSNTGKKFETYGDVKNVYYFSGYDASVIAFLTGVEGKTSEKEPATAEELFLAAMDQELLNLINIENKL